MPKVAAAKKTVAKKTAAVKVSESTEPLPGTEVEDDDDESEDTGSWFVGIDDTEDYINALLYGREGSGKTTSIARLANAGKGKVLIINAEGGVKKKALQKRGVNTDNLVIWPDPRKGTVITRLGLEKVHRAVKADLLKDPNSWYAVSWDSASEVHQAVLDHVQKDRVRRAKMRSGDVDEDFVDRADYGTMTKMVRDLLRKYRDLPCHFFVTALERKDKDEDTKKSVYGPAVTPALQTDLLGYVDFVLMMKAADEDGPYRALTRSNAKYRAKDRFDVLPRVMAEPMGDRLIAYFQGELEEENDPFQDDLPSSAKTAQDRPKDVGLTDDDDDEEDKDTNDDN